MWREVLYKCGQAIIGLKGLKSHCQISVVHKGSIRFHMWISWKMVTKGCLIITEIINSHVVVKVTQKLLIEWAECFGAQLQKFRGLYIRLLAILVISLSASYLDRKPAQTGIIWAQIGTLCVARGWTEFTGRRPGYEVSSTCENVLLSV